MRPRTAITATGLGLALALTPATAGAVTPQQSFAQCMRNASTTFEQDQCVGAESTRLEAQMNRVYASLRTNPDLSVRTRRLIVASQRQWLRYRKLDCAAAAEELRGGTQAPIAEGICVINDTRDRIRALRALRPPGA